MDFVGKKILILAGAGPHTKVVEAAKEMGLYTIVADYLPASRYSPAKLIADESLMNSIFDVDELTSYGIKNKIDGVVGFCIDPTQRPCQKIAENLQLPAFGTWDQVISLTDKKAFKKLCSDTGEYSGQRKPLFRKDGNHLSGTTEPLKKRYLIHTTLYPSRIILA